MALMCNEPIYNINKITGFVKEEMNIRYYKIHDICIEEVNVTNHYSKGELQQKIVTYV